MTQYTETEVPAGETRGQVLEMFAEGSPHVFVICHIDEDGQIDLKVETGGGIRGVKDVRVLLEKTLEALPDE